MASFSVRFLGCKVSQTDAQALRERLLRDGHSEVAVGGEVAVVNTCCVTNAGLAKSRQAASRAARSHARVYVTGCGARLSHTAFAGLPENVTVVAGLIRAAGAIDGVQRLRLSSIEINHVDDELVAALRETQVVGPHLHVPLQSGDDAVLRAMARRYSAETYLRKLEPLADFNLTADVIVGFPAEDDAAFERTLETVRAARLTKVHVFPYSPRPGTRTAEDDRVPPEVKKERSARLRTLSKEACRARWAAKVGRDDVVLVDRPGRGYGADYSPWLVEAPVGELVRVRGAGVAEEGVL